MLSRWSGIRGSAIFVGGLCVAVLACGSAGATELTVVLDNPVDGGTVVIGQEIVVYSTVTGEAGLTHAVLTVDGTVIRSDPPNEWSPDSYRFSQSWVPRTIGRVILSVVAFDQFGNSSDPVSIELRVESKDATATDNDLNQRATKASTPYVTGKYTNDTILVAGDSGLVISYCPAESTIVGGGFASDDDVVFYGQIKAGSGWLGYAWNTGIESHLIISYAVCLSNAPHASTTLVVGEAVIAGGEKGKAVATCPVGTIVTGGGYNAYPASDLRPYISRKDYTANAWESWAHNLTGSPLTHQAYAVCLSGLGGSIRQVQVVSPLVPPGISRVATPSCDPGEVLTSGGFGAEDDVRVRNSSGPWEIANDEWRVYARNSSSTTNRSFWGYAICATLGIFADGFESGNTTAWSSSVP